MFIFIDRVHSDASILDGAAKPEWYVKRAVELGQTAMAITDHGNLCNVPSFYKAAKAAGIAPIAGIEMYFVPDPILYKEMKGERFHVTMHARNEFGYKVLCDLSTASHESFAKHKSGKPIIDRHMIEALSKKERASLNVLSGCAGSIISRKILGEEPGSAKKEVQWWAKQFPNFWIELMHHDTDFDVRLNMGLVELARELKIPHVITNDPHYVHKDDACRHDALLAIQTGSDLDDPNRFRFDGAGYWLKSEAEIRKAFKSYGKDVWKPGIKQTSVIAEQSELTIPSWERAFWHIPKFPFVEDADKEVKRITKARLKELGLDKDKRYKKRLKKEMKAFGTVKTPTGAGMSDFLLITRDAIEFAKANNIPVGPGRGSAAGSLVSYLLETHNCDPIKYDLLFERFFNPDRPKMPDVDTDFSSEGRDKVLAYYPQRYGHDNVSPVAAFGTLQTKRAFGSLASASGIGFQERLALSKEIMEDSEGEVIWPQKIKDLYPDIVETTNALRGLKGSVSSHPAGVVVFDPADPIKNLAPKMWIPSRYGKDGRFVMQYNLGAVDQLMLLKQDTLGLRALDTIAECVRIIEDRHGIKLHPESWVPDEEKDDSKVYAMLARGESEGVFQFEGGAMLMGIQKVKPRRFSDLAVTTALYRAGPMAAGSPERFLKNRRDKNPRVIHKSLLPHLEATWGEAIYQESVFSILNEVAGLSWGRVDDVKRAISKKDTDAMESCRGDAVSGFVSAGMTSREAAETWRMIESQSAYGFNKSHAYCYSLVSYQMARLKYLYPLEFLTALLRTVEGKSQQAKDKRESYLKLAVSLGFKIMPPDINKSDGNFVASGDDELLFGLTDIRNVGASALVKIEQWRQEHGAFRSTNEVAKCLGTRDRSKGVFSYFAQTGTFRCFGIKADEQRRDELLEFQFTDNMVEYRSKFSTKLEIPKKNNDQCLLWGEIIKVDDRQTKAGKRFKVWTIRWALGHEWKINVWNSAESLFRLDKGSIVRVRGKWQSAYGSVSVGDSSHVKVYKAVERA